MVIQRSATLASQVARELRQQLQDQFLAGGKLPSEPELALQLGVSRGTVRQAITLLEREGIVIRRQGAGTFANPHVLRVQSRAETASEIGDLIRRAGFAAAIQLLRVETITLDEHTAARLDVEPGSPALQVDKLFLADGVPAVFIEDFIPQAVICAPFDPSELQHPIYEFLETRCGQTIVHNLSELVPMTAGGELAKRLEMTPGEALLRFDEVGFNRENQPVMFSRLYHKDRFIRFTLLRKRQV